MKFAELVSIGHNLAASVSDGVSFLFGAYEIDVYAAAQASPGGRVVIDFLTGDFLEGVAPPSLVALMKKSPEVLADLCRKHRALLSDFTRLEGRFGVDEVYGNHFSVTVEDHLGHRSEEKYTGPSGRRLRRGHRAPQGN